jgi:hypothetical protein
MVRGILLVVAAALMVLAPALAVAEPEVVKKVSPEAELVDFTMELADCKMTEKPCLTLTLKVKNITDSPQRFVTRVVLSESGKGVGGLIPRKGKPPVVAPGETAEAVYPMFHYEIPEKVDLEIGVMEQ